MCYDDSRKNMHRKPHVRFIQLSYIWILTLTSQYLIYFQVEMFYHGLIKGFTNMTKYESGLSHSQNQLDLRSVVSQQSTKDKNGQITKQSNTRIKRNRTLIDYSNPQESIQIPDDDQSIGTGIKILFVWFSSY